MLSAFGDGLGRSGGEWGRGGVIIGTCAGFCCCCRVFYSYYYNFVSSLPYPAAGASIHHTQRDRQWIRPLGGCVVEGE